LPFFHSLNEGHCERLLDMVGLERLQDGQLTGKSVSSDLIEVLAPNACSRSRRILCRLQPKLFQPDDEFLLHALLVSKGGSKQCSCARA
jgi:hypothetical protein